MCIAQHHADVFVAEQVLDGLQADAVHDQMAGEGVAQVMEAEVFDAGLATGRIEGMLHLVIGLALQIAKHIGRVQMARQMVELCVQRLIDGDHVGLIVLRLPHHDRLAREIDILPFQPQDFRLAHPGMHRHHDNGLEMRWTGGDQRAYFVA